VSDGTTLFTRRWTPDGDVKGVVGLVHGVCEHSGRWEHVGQHLSKAGYVLSAFDLRGHGQSTGRRGDVRFGPTLQDLDELLQEERVRMPGRPLFMYGQSLGGLLVLTYGLDRKPSLAGAVVSAPALHTALREQRLKIFLMRLVGGLVPSMTLPAGLDDTLLSRDPVMVQDRRADPLVHDRASAGLALDGLAAIDRVRRDVAEFPAPLSLIHGGADRINYLSGSEEIASKVRGDCTLRVSEGVFHQPHNDPDRKRILDDIVSWLDDHA
jgi:alpha-beta hydrolase superfamily lysophospholipase